MGIIGGRPTIDEEKIKKLKLEGMSIVAISEKLKISRGSIYDYR